MLQMVIGVALGLVAFLAFIVMAFAPLVRDYALLKAMEAREDADDRKDR